MKYRLFKHLSGGDDKQAVDLYLWTIQKRSGKRMEAGIATDMWKRKPEDYLAAAEDLYRSMSLLGYDYIHPIDIDPARELLNGSHRVACSLALGIKEVAVRPQVIMAWADPWDAQWFFDAGMDDDGIASLAKTMRKLSGGTLTSDSVGIG